jgi:predicted nucleic acid-binding protein
LAAKAHALYRQRKGTRSTALPDFFIGAHAAVAGHSILTRDPARYRSYFPTVKLFAPE